MEEHPIPTDLMITLCQQLKFYHKGEKIDEGTKHPFPSTDVYGRECMVIFIYVKKEWAFLKSSAPIPITAPSS